MLDKIIKIVKSFENVSKSMQQYIFRHQGVKKYGMNQIWSPFGTNALNLRVQNILLHTFTLFYK